MFTKDGKATEGMDTVIGPSVQVEGNFVGSGNVMVEGQVNGTLKTTGNLTIGSDAKIKADVEAKNIVTSGEIRGNQIIALEKIEMSKTAKIFGNIKTSALSMETGAVVNGKVTMSSSDQSLSEPIGVASDKKEKRNNK